MLKLLNNNTELEFSYNNVTEFYNDAHTIKDSGCRQSYKDLIENDKRGFRGLINEVIERSRYTYPLENHEQELEIDNQLGGISHKITYNDIDGEDINWERLIDGNPPMMIRSKTKGLKNGKIITLYVNVAENWRTPAEALLNKAKSVIQIVDYYESLGYRLEIITCTNMEAVWETYKLDGKSIKKVNHFITLKQAEDPLIKELIYTCISPWFFRYHIFAHLWANLQPPDGLGRSEPIKDKIKETCQTILIDNGECLTQDDFKKKIIQINKLSEAT